MTLAIANTVYPPLNTPIDGDRDYYDLTGFYQDPAAASPLEGCCAFAGGALAGCGCGCNGAPGGCGMGGFGALAEEEKGGSAWIPFTLIVGAWALLNFGGDIIDMFDPQDAETRRRRRRSADDAWARR